MIPPSTLELAVLTLASTQLVDAWNNASILEGRRAEAEALALAYEDGHRRHFWAAMLSCPYCLSHWAALALVGTCVVLPALALPGLRDWLMLPADALAIVRAGWILNSLLPPSARYSRG